MFCAFCSRHLQALPNQQTVDYPSFKLVIVGDGGTGNLSHEFSFLFSIYLPLLVKREMGYLIFLADFLSLFLLLNDHLFFLKRDACYFSVVFCTKVRFLSLGFVSFVSFSSVKIFMQVVLLSNKFSCLIWMLILSLDNFMICSKIIVPGSRYLF